MDKTDKGDGIMGYLADAIIERYIQEQKLKAYWDFRKGSIRDKSGNGNHLSFTDTPEWKSSPYGRVLMLDGSDDYLIKSVSNYGSNDSSGCVIALVKIDYALNSPVILASSDEAADDVYMVFQVSSVGKLVTYFNDGVIPSETGVTGSTNLVDGKFHVVAYWSNGSSYKLYVDGIAETLTPHAGGNTGDWFSGATGRDHIAIGVLKRTSTSSFLKGSVNFVQVYNTPVLESEIGILAEDALEKLPMQSNSIYYCKQFNDTEEDDTLIGKWSQVVT